MRSELLGMDDRGILRLTLSPLCFAVGTGLVDHHTEGA